MRKTSCPAFLLTTLILAISSAYPADSDTLCSGLKRLLTSCFPSSLHYTQVAQEEMTQEIPLISYTDLLAQEQHEIHHIMKACYSLEYGQKIGIDFYQALRDGLPDSLPTCSRTALIISLSCGLFMDRPVKDPDPLTQLQYNDKHDFYYQIKKEQEKDRLSQDFKQDVLDLFRQIHQEEVHNYLTATSLNDESWKHLSEQVMVVYTLFPPRLSIADIYAMVFSTDTYQGWQAYRTQQIQDMFGGSMHGFMDYFERQDTQPRWQRTQQHKQVLIKDVEYYNQDTLKLFPALDRSPEKLIVEISVLNPANYQDEPLIFYLVQSCPPKLLLRIH